MARGVLVPHERVRSFEERLARALAAAVAEQRRSVFRTLGMQPGAPKALTAAGNKKRVAQAGVVAAIVWSATAWRRSVDTHVAPVAAAVAADALKAAKAALPAERTMGMPVSSVATANRMVDRAYQAGDSIGTRVNAAAGRAADLATAADDVEAAMESADAILDTVVGSMASGAASISTTDVTSYLSGFFGNVYDGATKTWTTVGDDRVRYDHQLADGQEVSLNDVFVVGGEAMTGPHDESASDDQTIGCRCYLETDGVLPDGTTSDLSDSDTELAGGNDALAELGASEE